MALISGTTLSVTIGKLQRRHRCRGRRNRSFLRRKHHRHGRCRYGSTYIVAGGSATGTVVAGLGSNQGVAGGVAIGTVVASGGGEAAYWAA